MNRMKNLFTLLTLLLWTLVACSNDSAADEKPGSGGTDIPAGNLPMQNVARAIELIDNAVECYFTGTGMAMSRYYNPYTGNRSSELGSVSWRKGEEFISVVIPREKRVGQCVDVHQFH